MKDKLIPVGYNHF